MTDTAAAATDAASAPAGSAEGHRSALTETVDRLSLIQTLKDFEVANARVLDLARRVTELNQELIELRSDHERLRIAQNTLLARRAAPKAAAEAAATQALRAVRALKRRLR